MTVAKRNKRVKPNPELVKLADSLGELSETGGFDRREWPTQATDEDICRAGA